MHHSNNLTIFLQETIISSALEKLLLYVTYSPYVVAGLVFTIHPFTNYKYESFWRLFNITFMYWLNTVLKLCFSEGRPYFYNGDIMPKYCWTECNYGKPSGHAHSAVTYLLILQSWPSMGDPRSFTKKFLIRTLMGCIMFSRLFFGLHTVSQLALGALWGVFQLSLVGNFRRLYEEKVMIEVRFSRVNQNARFRVFAFLTQII